MRASYKIRQTVTMKPVRMPHHNMEAIVSAVELAFSVTREALLSKRRQRKFSHPRQALYFLLRELTSWSLPQIGDRLGRDHSTVLHGIRQVVLRRALDPVLDHAICHIIDQFRQDAREAAAA